MYAKMKAMQEAAAAAKGGGSSSAPAPAPTGPPTLKLDVLSVKPLKEPTVIMFGSTNYSEMGKKLGAATDEMPNLVGPCRLLTGFGATKIAFIASGCTAAHIVALGVDGEAFSWGRNDCGQLGHGDTTMRMVPTRVSALSGKKVAQASLGKAHSVFLGADGELMACGLCKQGAVGNGTKKVDQVTQPTALTVGAKFATIASGTNFNLAIDRDGDVWSWGWSEHGVLGNGSDGCYNTSDSSIKLTYSAEATPKRITTLLGKNCVDVACGQHHCAAVDGEGIVYTWGNGGYGRLGHKDQADKWAPTPIKEGLRAREVSCGSAHTAAIGWRRLPTGVVCSAADPKLFLWGKVKGPSQNAWMQPMIEPDLEGWHTKHFKCGASHNVAAADDSVIAWGSTCLSGELGFGLGGKKSSARPDKVRRRTPRRSLSTRPRPRTLPHSSLGRHRLSSRVCTFGCARAHRMLICIAR